MSVTWALWTTGWTLRRRLASRCGLSGIRTGSVVIDRSRFPHDEKLRYVRAVLPALNVLRRRTGLPHRILLDEAHYYLHDTDAPHLLDFERNGYSVVTYCASRLPQALLARAEVMIVTCERIGDVFGDQVLAGELRTLEERYRTGSRDETVRKMVSAVRSRYDLAEDERATMEP